MLGYTSRPMVGRPCESGRRAAMDAGSAQETMNYRATPKCRIAAKQAGEIDAKAQKMKTETIHYFEEQTHVSD